MENCLLLFVVTFGCRLVLIATEPLWISCCVTRREIGCLQNAIMRLVYILHFHDAFCHEGMKVERSV
ncbi:hypothetical protein V2J09_022073 [Rumex salicifolius]